MVFVGIACALLAHFLSPWATLPLDTTHGDRLWRFAHLFQLATDLYDGDEGAARAWLTKPARALDGATPLDHADTEAGAREVEHLIGRLEHAVYL